MTPQIVNTIGLIANIAGVAVALFYGYPQPSHEEGIGLGLELGTRLPDGRTVAEHDNDTRQQKRKYQARAQAGLGLMVLGFVLQLVATWL